MQLKAESADDKITMNSRLSRLPIPGKAILKKRTLTSRIRKKLEYLLRGHLVYSY